MESTVVVVVEVIVLTVPEWTFSTVSKALPHSIAIAEYSRSSSASR